MKLTDKEIIIVIVTLIIGIVGVACMSYGLSVINQEQTEELFPGYETPVNTSAATLILMNAFPEKFETPVELENPEVKLPEPDYCWGGSVDEAIEEPETEEPVEVYDPHKAQWDNINKNVWNGQYKPWY